MQATRVAGRPRNPALDERILTATRAALQRDGYAALSMEAVARSAAVGKQTLYRRWSRKPLLVFDAVFGDAARAAPLLPDTGSLAGDVHAVTAEQTRIYRTPGIVELVRGLVADCVGEPHLLDELRARFLRPRIAALTTIADAAVARGEVAASVERAALAEVIAGAMFAHFVLFGDDGSDFGAAVTRLLVDGARNR